MTVMLIAQTPASGQPAVVESVFPVAASIGADPQTDIMITLAEPLDAATVNSTSVHIFGRWSGPAIGLLTVEDGGHTIRFRPGAPFFAGERVSVTLSHAIRFVSQAHLEAGYFWSFWVDSEAASLDLEESVRIPIRRPGEAHIQSYGAYAGDLDSDGWSDLLIPNEISADVRVFLNRGGTYEDFTLYELPGSAIPSANEGADFNADGHVDVAVGNNASNNVNLLMGGEGGVLRVMPAVPAGGDSRAVCVVDADADGDDDIVTASRAQSSLYLLLNDGAGSFGSPILVDGGGDGETSCAVGDANGDGRADLFVGSFRSRNVSLLLGDGFGRFLLSASVSVPGPPWMLASGDVDGDGLDDVVSAGSSNNTVSVIRSDGQGSLRTPDPLPSGLFPLAIDLGDVDGDGDLDMVSSNYSSASFTLYENRGAGRFARYRDFPASRAGSCAILHDRDNNGTLDMSGIDELDDLLILFSNPKRVVATEPIPDVLSDLNISVHPQPATGAVEFSIVGNRTHNATVVVRNVLGRTVASFDVNGNSRSPATLVWDASHQPPGLYIATLTAERAVTSRPVVVVR